jgi:hypothetical protein
MVDLFDLYRITPDEADPTAQALVFETEGTDADEFDVLSVPVEIADNGDAIIRVPADVWARVPVETIIECDEDCDCFDDDEEYEDGAEDTAVGDAFDGAD